MRNYESTPKGAHESATTDLMIAVPELTSVDRLAAFVAGYADGMHHKFGLEVVDCAQALLHDQAREMLGMARQYASVTGPAWSAMVLEAAERDD